MWVFILLVIPQALGLVWMGPVVTAVQHLGPVRSRAMMSSLFLLINNLIGIAVGTWFFGFMSDHLRPQYGEDSMKYAFLIGLSFYVIAAGLFFAASRRMTADWVE
jgi:predicted MFS family arabinose efflux permease